MINEILQEPIIQRDFYLKQIVWFLETPIIKVFTWMRRVGKSSILKSLIQNLVNKGYFPKENIFYINKELIDFDWIKDYHNLEHCFQNFLQTADTAKRIFIGVDEVQDIVGREKFINSCLAKYQQKAEIFVTGSNSTMLSSDLSTYLSGRYVEFKIFPLSFEEYSLFTKKEKSKELFFEYLKLGGLPGNFTIKFWNENIFRYLSDVYSTIILKDVVKHFGVRNITFLEDLYKFTFWNIGNIVSAKNVSDYLKSQNIKISPEVVLNYLSFWTKVYLFSQIKSEDPNTKKYFEIFNKYYVCDLGLRNAIVGCNFTKDIGQLLENYVYNQLQRFWYQVTIWRLSQGQEIDFIATKNGITKYFQVCYLLSDESVAKREFSPLQKLKDNREKYVLSLDDFAWGNTDGIKHLSILQLEEIL